MKSQTEGVMKYLLYTIITVTLLPLVAQAQYVGSSRPPSRVEFLDSLAAKADTLDVDSLRFYFGTAADTTSPGKFYFFLDTDSLWHRADTSVSTVAVGVAVDSVPLGNLCRFQYRGKFSDADYDNLIIPGKKVVSDSVTAGQVAPIDTLRSNTKKMQGYGVAVDSVTIMLNIDPWVWVWEN